MPSPPKVAHVNVNKLLHNVRRAKTQKAERNAHKKALQAFNPESVVNSSKWAVFTEEEGKPRPAIKGRNPKVYIPGQTRKVQHVTIVVPQEHRSVSRSRLRSLPRSANRGASRRRR